MGVNFPLGRSTMKNLETGRSPGYTFAKLSKDFQR
jgi:hypothetical protein